AEADRPRRPLAGGRMGLMEVAATAEEPVCRRSRRDLGDRRATPTGLRRDVSRPGGRSVACARARARRAGLRGRPARPSRGAAPRRDRAAACCHGLWRQDDDCRGLGTVYGGAGNTLVLLRVDRDGGLAADMAGVLARAAAQEDGLANW